MRQTKKEKCFPTLEHKQAVFLQNKPTDFHHHSSCLLEIPFSLLPVHASVSCIPSPTFFRRLSFPPHGVGEGQTLAVVPTVGLKRQRVNMSTFCIVHVCSHQNMIAAFQVHTDNHQVIDDSECACDMMSKNTT